jgi:hypothetical protein
MKNPTSQNSESGQTLIETIAAIFVLTMAIVAALSLAINVLSTTTLNQNQIVATNLAREGVEMIRMIRDTNWLAAEASGNSNFILQSCSDISSSALCYPRARQAGATGGESQNLGDGTYLLVYNSAAPHWKLIGSPISSYIMYMNSQGLIGAQNGGGAATIYSRKIVISTNANPPYSASNTNNDEMIVQSIVAWTGKHCAGNASSDPSSFPPGCRVTVEEHLTNWKDY